VPGYCAGAADLEVFARAEGLGEDLAADLPVAVAGAASVARSSRVLSRFLVCARLRVFSRALSFGIRYGSWNLECLLNWEPGDLEYQILLRTP
jgi:hypothetical protein